MKSSGLQEFAVLFFSSASVRGCWFRRRAGRFQVKAHGVCAADPENPADAWKQLRKQLGFGRDCMVFLTGNLSENAVFYRTTAPRLNVRAMKEALLFDLPCRLPQELPDAEIQFTCAGALPEQQENAVNVYAFPLAARDALTAKLSQSLKKIDCFLYPLLALRLDDPPVYLPELEPDFFFAEGQWHDRSRWNDEYYQEWTQKFGELFDLSGTPDVPVKDYLGCLLIARFAAASDFRTQQKGLDILPRAFRPGRLRSQLKIMSVLLILLAAGVCWEHGGKLIRESREMSRLERERNQLSQQIAQLKRKLKSGEKEQKELARVLNQKSGENDLIGKLADLSKILPQNVVVQNLRWSDSSVDLTLRSEAGNLDLPKLLRPLKYWKIGQLQERRRNNDTSSMIMLKLVPAEENAK